MKKKIKVKGKNPILSMGGKSRSYSSRRPIRMSAKPRSGMMIGGGIDGEMKGGR